MIQLRKELDDEVERAIERLQTHPRAGAVLDGTATREGLAAYYRNVFHAVKHAPVLLHQSYEQLKSDVADPALVGLFEQKRREESGHHMWLAEDLAALGMPLDFTQAQQPSRASKVYRDFHEDIIPMNGHAFLGTAWMLESLALRCAGSAAANLQANARIDGIRPGSEAGLSFLLRHHEEDLDHVAQLGHAIETFVTDPQAHHYVLLCARFTGCLYADMF